MCYYCQRAEFPLVPPPDVEEPEGMWETTCPHCGHCPNCGWMESSFHHVEVCRSGHGEKLRAHHPVAAHAWQREAWDIIRARNAGTRAPQDWAEHSNWYAQ